MSGNNLSGGGKLFKKKDAVKLVTKKVPEVTPEKQQALSRDERLAKRQKLQEESEELAKNLAKLQSPKQNTSSFSESDE